MKSNSVGTKLIVNSKLVGGLKSINGIEINADTIDVTDLGNTDGYREKLPGFKDVGDLTGSGFMDGDNDGQNECYALMNSGEVVPCAVVFPAPIGMTWVFQAGVVKFSTSADVGDAVTFDTAMAVSGKPSLVSSLKLDKAALAVVGTGTGTVSVTGGTGTITAESEDTDVCTVSVSSSTVTVTGVAAGKANVAIHDAAGRYNVIPVTVTAAGNVG